MKRAASSNPIIVEKEKISEYKFPRNEVLRDPDAIRSRRERLKHATTLGNIDNNKAKIVFEDSEGVKQVETTIWATSEKNISLKSGVTIPIHRIHEVRFL